jgi:hypothetical protein
VAFLEDTEVYDAYTEASKEADIWREDYPEYERLADNGLLDDLDENLPEVNDGSLAAALFKLPKRIVNSKLTGRARALDRQDTWITELANLQWEKKIVPNANSQAPFHRKIKDAVRKSAIYGGQPIITLFVERGDYQGSDIIVPPAADVILEAQKVSDYDSDIIFWDIYYSKLQVENLKEEAIEEVNENVDLKRKWKAAKFAAEAAGQKFDEDAPEPYNKWYVSVIDDILSGQLKEERPGNKEVKVKQDKGVQQSGYHFVMAFQRGVNAPFKLMFGKKCVREWSNPDPSGDIPVHYLYCYQDFVNPYGTGIVKLAGGTQNVLDYFRQADVLATQIGIRRPRILKGNTDDVDMDSLDYTEDAIWELGDAEIDFVDMANGVYNQLPNRINMYKSSLNNILPMGDTSVSATAGDPLASKTPAGVRQAVASLGIDDEDYKDNMYMTVGAVARSMINIEFANMQGNDTLTFTDEERDLLAKAGIDFVDPLTGQMTNELDVEWDLARATFDFDMDMDNDKAKDDAQKLEGLKTVADFLANPNTQLLVAKPEIVLGNKRVNIGELVGEIVSLSTDNDKVITDVTPDEKQAEAEAATTEPQPGQEAPAPAPGLTPEELALKNRELDIKQQGNDLKMTDLKLKGNDQAHKQALAEHAAAQSQQQQAHSQEQDRRNASLPTATPKKGDKKGAAKLPEKQEIDPDAQRQTNIEAIMEQHHVDPDMAEMMLKMEESGVPVQEILAGLERHRAGSAA